MRVVMEGVVLLMVCLSPWAFGAADPPWEFALYVGVGVLAALWAAAMLVEGRLTWRKCPVVLCLAALYALGFWQVTPLPRPVLATVSPAAARLYDQLLPAEPEALPNGEARAVPVYPPGSTISLYPAATRRELVRLLAMLLVFAVVRNNVASPGAFRRLSIAATVNGAALSLFALAQYFGSPHDTVYWKFPSGGGEVFGPFICRNHFSFYVNVCVGLAAGLLLSFGAGPRRGRDAPAATGWLQDPRAVWVGIALVLMLGAVALSLSRGGLLALIGAACVCLALKLRQSPRFSQAVAVVLLVGAALALLCWFGADRVQARLATVLDGRAAQEDRVPLWSRLLPEAMHYPVLGSGYGTFDYVEPLTRTTGEDAGWRYEHAHNDYLEALLEGGVVRLGLTLLAVGLVYRLGLRALARDPGGPAGALALGGLFGVTALAIHGFVDFGLHIPSIALLAVVVCAQLCGAAGDVRAEADRYSFSLLGLAPVAGAVAAVCLGLVVAAEGWRDARVQGWRAVAARLRAAPDPARHERAVAYLEAAAALAPEYAVLNEQLGEAHLDLLQEETEELGRGHTVAAAADAVTAFAGGPAAGPPGVGAAVSCLAASAARDGWAGARRKDLAGQHLVPGLRRVLLARDGCPLLAEPHLRLALHHEALGRAEPRDRYLARAKRLAPDDPDAWYLCGVQELFDGRASEARESWRRSLDLSDRHLPEIAAGLARVPDAAAALGQVLPDRPALWLAAADQLYPGPEAADRRRPLVEKAVLLWERPPGPLGADELHRLAGAYASLGRGEDALQAYQKALDRNPDQAGWRLDYARLLREQGRLQDSRRELSDVLSEQPGNAEVRGLLEAVNHDIAAGQ